MNTLRTLVCDMIAGASISVANAADAGPLTLASAMERAINASPSLQAAALGLDAATEQRDWDALKPPVSMGFELENFVGSGEYSGLDQTEATLAVSRLFEGGDKAELRGTAGGRRIELAQVDVTTTQVKLTAVVERLFFDALTAQANELTALVAQDIAQETYDIVARRATVGRSSAAELNTAEVRLAGARLLVARAEQQAFVARTRLAYVWGDPAPTFTSVAGDLLRIPVVPSLSDIERDLNHNPELQRLEAEARLASAERQLATAQGKTDWELAAGVRYFNDPSDAALVASVSVPLGQKKRAAPLDRAALARASQVPLELEQRRRELSAAVTSLHAELAYRYNAITVIRDEMLPKAIAAKDVYRLGFERGGYRLIELTESQNLALRMRQDLVDMAADFHLVRIELSRLTGRAAAAGATS